MKNKDLNYVTEEGMYPALRDVMSEFTETIIEKIDFKNKNYRDQIMANVDGVTKELQTMREENAAGELRFRRVEKRISTLEQRKN